MQKLSLSEEILPNDHSVETRVELTSLQLLAGSWVNFTIMLENIGDREVLAHLHVEGISPDWIAGGGSRFCSCGVSGANFPAYGAEAGCAETPQPTWGALVRTAFLELATAATLEWQGAAPGAQAHLTATWRNWLNDAPAITATEPKQRAQAGQMLVRWGRSTGRNPGCG
jgi:hypothetical protein